MPKYRIRSGFWDTLYRNTNCGGITTAKRFCRLSENWDCGTNVTGNATIFETISVKWVT